LNSADRALWDLLSRFLGRWHRCLTIVQPATVIRWHRLGWRLFWRHKSRARRRGRPLVDPGVRALIRRLSLGNPIWGVPRIHGELLKLGYEVAEATVAKYMVRPAGPPGQSWRTFLRNHLHEIAAIDLFTVPTVTFKTLYVFLVLSVAGPTPNRSLERHRLADGRVDQFAAYPGVSFRNGSALPDP
jgi:putative transposase